MQFYWDNKLSIEEFYPLLERKKAEGSLQGYSSTLHPHEYGFSLKQWQTGMSVVFSYLLITQLILAGLKRVILVHGKHLFSIMVYQLSE